MLLESQKPFQRRPVPPESQWTEVCGVSDIVPGTGVAACVEGEQIAVIRGVSGDSIFAISNYDPFSKAFVLSRGIVGDRAGVPKIASPMYKQSFDLSTGLCLDDPTVRLPVYPVTVAKGRVFVRMRLAQAVEGRS